MILDKGKGTGGALGLGESVDGKGLIFLFYFFEGL